MTAPLRSRFFLTSTLIIVFLVGALFGFYASWFWQNRDAVWARFNQNEVVRKSDVWPLIENDVNQLELNIYNIKKRAVSEFIQRKVLADLRKEGGASTPDFLAREASEQTISPSEDEVTAFLKERGLQKEKLSQAQLQSAVSNLQVLRKQQIEQKALEKVYATAVVKFLIPRPFDRIVSLEPGQFPPREKGDGSIQIIQIGNFHCPFCSAAERRNQELFEKFKDKISFFFRFSVAEDPDSIAFRAAEATFCANEQGQFWNYYQDLIQRPPTELNSLIVAAESTKLNLQSFRKCLVSREKKGAVIEESLKISKLGLADSPTYLVNQRVVKGLPSIEVVEDILESTKK
jgi:protein-disulfide isomerase